MVFKLERLGKIRTWDRWVCMNAGHSIDLVSSLKPFAGLEVTDKITRLVFDSINVNRRWVFNLETDTSANSSDCYEMLANMASVIEVCRLYGNTSLGISGGGLSKLRNQTHPWMNNRSYFDALVETDLLIVEDVCPDPVNRMYDWQVVQDIVTARTRKLRKLTLFTNASYVNLPSVQKGEQFMELTKLAQEKHDKS